MAALSRAESADCYVYATLRKRAQVGLVPFLFLPVNRFDFPQDSTDLCMAYDCCVRTVPVARASRMRLYMQRMAQFANVP